jgi:Methyltransferase domain
MSVISNEFSNIVPYLAGSRFDENLTVSYLKNGPVRHRTDELLDICRNKRVLHIGCCDHIPLIKQKIDSHDWLHGLITECSEYTVGIDIDVNAISEALKSSGLDNIFLGDITSSDAIEAVRGKQFDIALFGEVVEHISNPAAFLQRFRENYGDIVEHIVITVPNAFRAGNVKGAFRNAETINSDHRFFFTPYTISKIACDAGFTPEQIVMATYTRAGWLKTQVLNRAPLLAEDIIFVGSHRAGQATIAPS